MRSLLTYCVSVCVLALSIAGCQPEVKPDGNAASNGTPKTELAADDKEAVAALEAKHVKLDKQDGRVVLADFSRTETGDDDLKLVKGLLGLQRLTIYGPSFTSAGLKHVEEHPSLMIVELASTSVGDAGLKSLSTIPTLKMIGLRRTDITDAGIAHLKGLKNLVDIDLRFSNISLEGVKHLVEIKSLKAVKLQESKIDDESVRLLVAGLPDLQNLNIGKMARLTSASFAALKDCKTLRTLEVENLTDITGADLVHFAGLKNIEFLNIRFNNIKGGDLEHIAGLTKITSLNLRDTVVNNAGLQHLKQMKDLEALDLTETIVGDQGMATLTEFAKLSDLRLEYTGITDVGLEQLGKIKTLTILDLSKADISSAGLAHLVGLENLTELEIDECSNVDGSAVEHLKKMKSLKKLTAGNTGLAYDSSAMEELKAALPNLEINTGGI